MGQTIYDKIGQFRNAARSVTQREDTVPAISGA